METTEKERIVKYDTVATVNKIKNTMDLLFQTMNIGTYEYVLNYSKYLY